jgi:hypothetical protein
VTKVGVDVTSGAALDSSTSEDVSAGWLEGSDGGMEILLEIGGRKACSLEGIGASVSVSMVSGIDVIDGRS